MFLVHKRHYLHMKILKSAFYCQHPGDRDTQSQHSSKSGSTSLKSTPLQVDITHIFKILSYRRTQRTSSHWRTWISVLKRLWTIQRITTLLLIKEGELLNRQCFSETADQPAQVCLWIATRTSALVHLRMEHFFKQEEVREGWFKKSFISRYLLQNICWTGIMSAGNNMSVE